MNVKKKMQRRAVKTLTPFCARRKRTLFDTIVLLSWTAPDRCSAPRHARARSSRLIAVVVASTLVACAGRRQANVITPLIGTRQTGIASWYGHPYHGRATASGEIYDMERDTAAHRRFAFGTWVRVYNLDNGRATEVRINDRGPFKRGRIIDLSRAAARRIDMIGPGTAHVRLVVIAASDVPAQRSSVSAPRWSVQVARFRDPSPALALALRLEDPGRHVRVIEGDQWFQVLVAGLGESEGEARRHLEALRVEFPDAQIFPQEIHRSEGEY